MDRRALGALLLVVGLLAMAALACTSDQEWIIPRTETPTPTYTPIPRTTATEFETGDAVVVVAPGGAFQVPQTNFPEADRRNNRVIGGGCFPGTTVTVNDVAQGEDGLIYYKVRCILDGWVPADNVQAPE